jgi:hypothetical protein
MDTALTANLTRTHLGAPLATVEGLPGGCADLTPAQLRALAAALEKIATDCEARPASGRHWTPERRSYPVK